MGQAFTDSANLFHQSCVPALGRELGTQTQTPQPVSEPAAQLGEASFGVKQESGGQTLERELKAGSAEHPGDMREGVPGGQGGAMLHVSICWGGSGGGQAQERRDGEPPWGMRLGLSGSIFLTSGSHGWDTGKERGDEAGVAKARAQGLPYRAKEFEL